MNLVADLHIHTVACAHAYSTFKEILDAGREKGLRMIGLADHGPACPDPVHEYYFRNGHRFPKELDGIQIRFGIEDDIVDRDGNLGLARDARTHLDYIMVGMHGRTWLDALSAAERTDVLINALHREPAIKIITHPGLSQLTVSLDDLLPACRETGTCVELNDSKLRYRDEAILLLEKAAEHRVGVVVNSDAHIYLEVGSKDKAVALLRETGFPEEQVVNTSLEKINQYLGI